MSLNRYEKNKQFSSTNEYNKNQFYVVQEPEYSKTTLWSLLDKFNNNSKFSKPSRILFPAIFVFLGLFFIYQNFLPQIQQFIQENNGYYTTGNLSPVDEEYIDLSLYVSKPKDLSTLTQQAINQHILEKDDTSKNYRGTFYISIPSIGINRLPVKANVDSSSEESYNQVLNYSLAHFESTGLPISEVKNNIVIYGHSASLNYNPRPTDPMVAFSFLPDLKVGDEITIEIDGKTFTYQMFKSKIVEPNDLSIITGTAGKGNLTLFTCFPLGSDAKRYTAVARPVS